MMASSRQLTRIEREKSLWFGLRWSFVGCVAALLLLSGCSLFDSGAVRYNSVQGERRAPVLNPGGAGYASTEMAKQQLVQTVAPQPMAAAPMSAEVAAAFAQAQQQQAPQSYAPQPMPSQQAAVPQAMGADGYPTLPATVDQPQPAYSGDAAIQADINALERDINNSQAQRGQMAAQQQQDGWMPNLGIGEWFGGNGAPPAAAPTSTQTSSYAPVQLPIPPAQPGAATADSLNVPLAPDVQSAQMTHIPSSLIPPGEEGSGYLTDSRYAERRGTAQSRPF